MFYGIVYIVILLFIFLLYRRRRTLSGQKRHLAAYLTAFLTVLLTLAMVRYPKEAFDASVAGLEVWWHIVFPALMPFFVFAQILVGLGVVHLMGVFLEPVMRPLFNVPGTGSFVMAMGLASGFPIGAVLTAELRGRNLCNRAEAERLLCFTNTADPLFMFGAVAVGMLGYPQAGLSIALAHYLSSLTLGLFLRFYGYNEPASIEPSKQKGRYMARALHALVQARAEDGRPLGQLMGDAIRKSVDTLLMIGGFIILFSVIIRILEIIGVVGFLGKGLASILNIAGLSPALAPALVSGMFEIDVGCQFTAALPGVSMREKIIACSMIIAFSGLSVHAQVASIIAGTDIRISPYIVSRLAHALVAGLYTAVLLGPAGKIFGRLSAPVFLQTEPAGSFSFWWSRTAFMLNQMLFFCALLAGLAAALYIARAIRLTLFFSRRRK